MTEAQKIEYEAQGYLVLEGGLDSGELAEEATNLSSDVLGATLLTLADIDSEEFVSGISPITGVLT